MPTANFFQSSPYQVEADRISRNRRMAEALQQESMQGAPAGQMSGGVFIPTSPLTHLAKALHGLNAKKSIEASDRDFTDLSQRRNQALAQALSGMPQASMQAQPTNQEGTGAFDMSGTNVPQRMVQPTMQQNAAWLGNLSNIGPDALQIGSSVLGMQQKSDENSLNREARLHERILALDAASQNAQLAREERAAMAQEAAMLRRELQKSQQDFMGQQARIAAQDRRAQRQPQIIQTETGPMQVTGNRASPIIGPDGQPVKPKGTEKALPTSAAQKLMENQQNLRRAEQALALISGKKVGDKQGDPNATGWKGLLPDFTLQRIDPSGVSTRAAIGDLGSLVIHDRSGAAVTAAEFPRLKPFIPTVTDDPQTVKKKLERFVEEYRDVVNEAANFYMESGYKVPTGALVPGVPGMGELDNDPLGLRKK